MTSDKQRMVTALRATEFDVVDRTILQLVADLLGDPDVEPEELRDVATRLLRTSGADRSPLYHALLRNCVVTDRELELRVRARRRVLFESPSSAPDAMEEIVSIAMQAESTAFAWVDDRPIARDDGGWMDVVCHAMYQPLHTIRGVRDLDRVTAPPDVAQFIASRLALADEEDAIRASLQRDVPGMTPELRAVREQYEAAPFPRWTRLRRRAPRALPEDVSRRLPGVDVPPLREARRVLVAGCGTGQDAIQAAWRYAPAHVVAIDVSAASLAVAARMARLHGVENIEFVHDDLMSFAGDPFDAIECSGVLHHLPDPEAGLQALAALLQPRGVIGLALYSNIARASLARIRERYSLKPGTSDDELRAIRDRLLEREPEIATQPEMYNLSEMRDFLAHAHEDTFTIPRIASMLAANGLTFLGFESLPPAVAEQWQGERMGEWNRLDAWDAFERRHPETFARMYRLLARRDD